MKRNADAGGVRLYNMIFPLFWLYFAFVLSPLAALVILGGNLAIDTLVVWLIGKWLHQPKGFVKASFWKVWLCGLGADIVASFALSALCLVDVFDIEWQNAIFYDPYSNVLALLTVLVFFLLAILLIYFLDVKWGFHKALENLQERKKAALVMAIVTAPWLFLVPTALFFS